MESRWLNESLIRLYENWAGKSITRRVSFRYENLLPALVRRKFSWAVFDIGQSKDFHKETEIDKKYFHSFMNCN